MVEQLYDYHNGDGVCRYLDQKNLQCKIYEHRPIICNVEKSYEFYFNAKFSEDEYLKMNYKGCDILMERENKKKEQEKEKQEKEEKDETLENVALSGINQETVQRYGSAIKEHIVSYDGIDNETGKKLSKGLESVSKSKINPDYKEANIKQQAGFSAEIKETARENAERIINGDKTRVSRTDDIGNINDQLHDHVVLDRNGNPIAGTASQMKFVGKNPEELLDKFVSQKYDKYIKDGCGLEIPSDRYDGVKEKIQEKIAGLQKQLKYIKEQGKSELILKKQEEIEKYQKIDKALKKSNVSTIEAIEARLNPKLSTIKDIAKLGHQAGKATAKNGAIIGGGISTIKNISSVVMGETDVVDAVVNVGLDTGKAAAISYGTGFAGSVIKGGMQNSSSEILRGLSKTGVPAGAVISAIELVKSFVKYFNNEIDGTELIEELGEKGTGIITSGYSAGVGAVIGGTLGSAVPFIGTAIGGAIGGVVGGIFGYTVNGIIYREAIMALKEVKISRERREQIEKMSELCIEEQKRYQNMIKQYAEEQYKNREVNADTFFKNILDSIIKNDVEQYISTINEFGNSYGLKLKYETYEEIDEFMLDDTLALKI
jgi:hypothetical protein